MGGPGRAPDVVPGRIDQVQRVVADPHLDHTHSGQAGRARAWRSSLEDKTQSPENTPTRKTRTARNNDSQINRNLQLQFNLQLHNNNNDCNCTL